MAFDDNLSEDLKTLNLIAETLNRATDVQSALYSALAHLVELMGLETGWIFLIDPSSPGYGGANPFVLAAHRNLPPGLEAENEEVWQTSCECQKLCGEGRLSEAYNEIHCRRLASVMVQERGLSVHASTPLRSGGNKLGILNVAGEDWSSFNSRSLALLTNVGNQMGVAIERAQLFDLLQERRIQEQASLLDFSNQLLSRPNPEDLMGYLVNEVRRLLKVDACTLVLRDTDPAWLVFQAASGWKVDPVEANRRIPFDADSGPGWVMRSQRPLLVKDIQTSDPTSWAPDWLKAEGFHGHGVVPLVVEERSIGALVINARKPRKLGEDELRFLQLMANQAAIAIETARLYMEEVERHRMEEELVIGRRIQLSLLPKTTPTLPGWEFGVRYQPARQIGGDFYDFCWLPGGVDKLGLLIGDVSGKGVPAALFMAMCRTTIRTTALSGRSPSNALIRANELILKDSQADLYLSAICAALDPQAGYVTYANAGHNRPLLIRAKSGEIQELSARGIILGEFEKIELEEQEIEILPGDVIVFYTDGVTEATNDQQEPFGEERLRAAIASKIGASAEEILFSINEALDHFSGNTQQEDDLTLVVVRRLPET